MKIKKEDREKAMKVVKEAKECLVVVSEESIGVMGNLPQMCAMLTMLMREMVEGYSEELDLDEEGFRKIFNQSMELAFMDEKQIEKELLKQMLKKMMYDVMGEENGK